MPDATHWDGVYVNRDHADVSWFEAHPSDSLELISMAALNAGGRILDVGAGASRLADTLIAQGHTSLVLADISAAALAVTRRRLGDAGDVKYLVGDILKLALPQVALWHDRALFHFLSSAADRATYRRQAIRTVRPGGYMVLATFAEDGPDKCSDLPVTRYSAEALAGQFAPEFEVVESRRVVHVTPADEKQPFTFCLLRRPEDSALVQGTSEGDG